MCCVIVGKLVYDEIFHYFSTVLPSLNKREEINLAICIFLNQGLTQRSIQDTDDM